MNKNMNNSRSPVTIMLLGLSRSERNSLQVILPRRLARPVFLEPSPDERPDLILFSPDDSEAAAKWTKLTREYGDIPAICLSHKEQHFDGVTSMTRPIKAELLVENINRLLDKAAPADAEPSPPAAPETPKKTQRKRRPANASAEKTCDPDEKLIGIALKAWKKQQKTRSPVIVEGLGFFLFTPDGMVITNNSENVWRSMCATHLHPNAMSLRVVRNAEADRLLNSTERKYIHDQETLLWKLAAYCSRGAFPRGISARDVMMLRRWPNCTRLPEPLKVAAMSALFHQAPISPAEAAERLGTSLGDVATFVACADALSLLRSGQAGSTKKRSGRKESDESSKWSSRVLGKLARTLVGRVLGRDRRRA